MKILLAISMLTLIFCASCKQNKQQTKSKDLPEKIAELVLSENVKGQEYFLKVGNPKSILEYKVTYLGDISFHKRDTLRFVYSAVFTGIYENNKHANSRIYLFNIGNNFLGYYYVGGHLEVLPSVEGEYLVFNKQPDHCNQITRISFRDSIPKEIFIHCTEKDGRMFGDIYGFTKK